MVATSPTVGLEAVTYPFAAASLMIKRVPSLSHSVVQTIYRKDYAPTPYLISDVHLDFKLGEESTTVASKLSVQPNHEGNTPEMSLDGTLLIY